MLLSDEVQVPLCRGRHTAVHAHCPLVYCHSPGSKCHVHLDSCKRWCLSHRMRACGNLHLPHDGITHREQCSRGPANDG
ncbi:hypothetical protein RRG08_000609 [Elysia crispata]|uniref:Uncharacterized protein n=1 Tax=Elysia crispata TaxID=231223 RepID=A0AAE0Y8X3_9GAST|nr:hypothetical protein RRG08_000609 [Elysia crispata]